MKRTFSERALGAVVYVLHFDGCANPTNPGRSGAGWCITTPEGEGVRYGFHYLGPKETNNVAEYTALLEGMDAFVAMVAGKGACSLKVYGDSKLVVEQTHGRWKCKAEHLKPFVALAKEKLAVTRALGHDVSLEHVRRKKNTWADKLSNLAVKYECTMNRPFAGPMSADAVEIAADKYMEMRSK